MTYDEPNIIVPRFNEESGFYTTPKRSEQISNIPGKDTKPEMITRKFLHSNGFRYRLHVKKLPGKPD
jgi:DNA mismatch endonuclease (patch repair protein)